MDSSQPEIEHDAGGGGPRVSGHEDDVTMEEEQPPLIKTTRDALAAESSRFENDDKAHEAVSAGQATGKTGIEDRPTTKDVILCGEDAASTTRSRQFSTSSVAELADRRAYDAVGDNVSGAFIFQEPLDA